MLEKVTENAKVTEIASANRFGILLILFSDSNPIKLWRIMFNKIISYLELVFFKLLSMCTHT